MKQLIPYFYLPLLLLLHGGWHVLVSFLTGAVCALIIHGLWLQQIFQRKVEASGLSDALLAGDPEVLARLGSKSVDRESLATRLNQVASQAAKRARLPWTNRLSFYVWIVITLVIAINLIGGELVFLPWSPPLGYLAIALVGVVITLNLLIGECARQHFLFSVSAVVARSLGMSLSELFVPRKPPVERIAQRLGVTVETELITMLLPAALFIVGIVTPLIWFSMLVDYMPQWGIVLPLLMIALNCLGGILCLVEVSAYRRDVRGQLAISDLPLRMALGQFEQRSRIAMTLVKEKSELERAAQDAAGRLPAEIGLRTERMRSGLAVPYYGLAVLSVLLVGLFAWLYTEDTEVLFGLAFASLPVLIFPLFAIGYKRTVHAEELVRLLREQQVS